MKEKITSIMLSFYLIIFLILNILIKDNDISLIERRKLAQMPKLDYNFTDNFEKYALDQFVFRDTFRSIKTKFNLNILNNTDNNKYVLKNGYIYKIEYPLNQKSLDNFINMINKIKKDLNNNKVYLSVIPDKSYYLSDEYLKLDYNYLFNEINNISGINYIPLNDILSINDYYKTDTHWDQSSLIKVVDRLSKYMDFSYSNNYSVNKYENFKGVYYGQLGLNIKSDTLEYLTSNSTNNSIIDDIEHKNEVNVYNISKLNTSEPYDIYLNGSTPLVTINTNNSSDKELIIFRDSFGSSLAPLLIDSYKKITLVDLRYISYDLLDSYLSISNNEDILFLYSTIVINNSDTLKY